jgi:hypothetical protein
MTNTFNTGVTGLDVDAGKLVTDTAPQKAKAPAKAPKPEGDQYLDPYRGMKHWPVKTAGVAPTRQHVITARALLGSPRSAGTKRELAIAAYLRDDALNWHTGAVANALMCVCGGTLNRLLNVVNADICGSMGLAKLVAGKADGYKSYRLELNGKGKAKVARYMAAMGLTVAAGTVDADKAPPAQTPTTDAHTGM